MATKGEELNQLITRAQIKSGKATNVDGLDKLFADWLASNGPEPKGVFRGDISPIKKLRILAAAYLCATVKPKVKDEIVTKLNSTYSSKLGDVTVYQKDLIDVLLDTTTSNREKNDVFWGSTSAATSAAPMSASGTSPLVDSASDALSGVTSTVDSGEAAEQMRREQEEAERKRREQEEAERKRREQEEAERKRKEQEEAERQRKEQEAAERQRKEQEAADATKTASDVAAQAQRARLESQFVDEQKKKLEVIKKTCNLLDNEFKQMKAEPRLQGDFDEIWNKYVKTYITCKTANENFTNASLGERRKLLDTITQCIKDAETQKTNLAALVEGVKKSYDDAFYCILKESDGLQKDFLELYGKQNPPSPGLITLYNNFLQALKELKDNRKMYDEGKVQLNDPNITLETRLKLLAGFPHRLEGAKQTKRSLESLIASANLELSESGSANDLDEQTRLDTADAAKQDEIFKEYTTKMQTIVKACGDMRTPFAALPEPTAMASYKKRIQKLDQIKSDYAKETKAFDATQPSAFAWFARVDTVARKNLLQAMRDLITFAEKIQSTLSAELDQQQKTKESLEPNRPQQQPNHPPGGRTTDGPIETARHQYKADKQKLESAEATIPNEATRLKQTFHGLLSLLAISGQPGFQLSALHRGGLDRLSRNTASYLNHAAELSSRCSSVQREYVQVKIALEEKIQDRQDRGDALTDVQRLHAIWLELEQEITELKANMSRCINDIWELFQAIEAEYQKVYEQLGSTLLTEKANRLAKIKEQFTAIIKKDPSPDVILDLWVLYRTVVAINANANDTAFTDKVKEALADKFCSMAQSAINGKDPDAIAFVACFPQLPGSEIFVTRELTRLRTLLARYSTQFTPESKRKIEQPSPNNPFDVASLRRPPRSSIDHVDADAAALEKELTEARDRYLTSRNRSESLVIRIAELSLQVANTPSLRMLQLQRQRQPQRPSAVAVAVSSAAI